MSIGINVLKKLVKILLLTIIMLTVSFCKKANEGCSSLNRDECTELHSLEKKTNKKLKQHFKRIKITPECKYLILKTKNEKSKYLSCQHNNECTFWKDYWERPFPINNSGKKAMNKLKKKHSNIIAKCKDTLNVPLTTIPKCYPDYSKCITVKCENKECVLDTNSESN